MSIGKELVEIDSKNIWHPFSPIVSNDPVLSIERGDGAYLYTSDGKEIIDAVSSWWVNIHGHANKELAQAIYDQASKLEHTIFAGFTHEPAVRLSQNILSITPEEFTRVFFSDDGSTSIEVALKLALQYWELIERPRNRVVALDGAYHGDTFGAMSVGARDTFNTTFEPYMFDVEFLPFPSNNKILDDFEKLCKNDPPACLIYEPLLQGSAGMRMYSPEILESLLKIAKKYEVICIADEVLTGFGRTGKMFASDYCETKPDLMCMSKGITGGTLPLGLTVISNRIQSAFQRTKAGKPFYHGHSYTANAIACAVSNKSFEMLTALDCQNNIKRIEEKHFEAKKRFEGHKKVRDCRCLGTVIAIEIETGAGTSYFNDIRNVLYNEFLQRNILLRPLGNVIYILPPYVIENSDLDYIYSQIEEVLNSI